MIIFDDDIYILTYRILIGMLLVLQSYLIFVLKKFSIDNPEYSSNSFFNMDNRRPSNSSIFLYNIFNHKIPVLCIAVYEPRLKCSWIINWIRRRKFYKLHDGKKENLARNILKSIPKTQVNLLIKDYDIIALNKCKTRCFIKILKKIWCKTK